MSLNEAGTPLLKGKFHESELKIIDDKLAAYKAATGYTDIDLCPLLRENPGTGRTSKRKDLKIWAELHELLPRRDPHSIYQAAIRRIIKANAPATGPGSWDAATLSRLTVLQMQHGNNWADIGRVMGRHGDACKKAYERYIGQTAAAGGSSQASSRSSASAESLVPTAVPSLLAIVSLGASSSSSSSTIPTAGSSSMSTSAEKSVHSARKYFDTAEDAQLHQVLLRLTGAASAAEVTATGAQWKAVAEELGNKRTPDDYRRRWKRLAIHVSRKLTTAVSITNNQTADNSRLDAQELGDATADVSADAATAIDAAAPQSSSSRGRQREKTQSKKARKLRRMKLLVAIEKACSAEEASSSSSSTATGADSGPPLSMDSVDWSALGTLLAHSYPRGDVVNLIRKAAKLEGEEQKKGIGATDVSGGGGGGGSDSDSDSDKDGEEVPSQQRSSLYRFRYSLTTSDGDLPISQASFPSQILRLSRRFAGDIGVLMDGEGGVEAVPAAPLHQMRAARSSASAASPVPRAYARLTLLESSSSQSKKKAAKAKTKTTEPKAKTKTKTGKKQALLEQGQDQIGARLHPAAAANVDTAPALNASLVGKSAEEKEAGTAPTTAAAAGRTKRRRGHAGDLQEAERSAEAHPEADAHAEEEAQAEAEADADSSDNGEESGAKGKKVKKRDKKRKFYAQYQDLYPDLSPDEVNAAYREHRAQKKEAKRTRKE